MSINDIDTVDKTFAISIYNSGLHMTQLIAPIPRLFHKYMENSMKDAVMEKLAEQYSFAKDIVVTLK